MLPSKTWHHRFFPNRNHIERLPCSTCGHNNRNIKRGYFTFFSSTYTGGAPHQTLKHSLYKAVFKLQIAYCSPITNLYGIALLMLTAFPLTTGTSHTLNRKKSYCPYSQAGCVQRQPGVNHGRMDLCNSRCCFHPNFDASQRCVCVKSFSKSCY